ncbi:MAG TPA: NAD(P)/FAD-dependent oxidoreductase [Mycobacterium sp.]|nr:NAD(P)/FAD-dependent oxidoreductase [Mycobacterium sp.]
MVQLYDDGDAGVPGGCADAVGRVVVVGAGMAGLTVANALANAGVDCVVVEARDRIGGRLHTVELGGVSIDLGGSWIHTPIGNPLRRFADQVGVSCCDGNPLAEMVCYDRAGRRRLSTAEFEELKTLQLEAFPEALDGLRDALGPEASAAQAIDRFVADTGLAEAYARRARAALGVVVSAEAADLPEHQSLRWLWHETEYDGDFLGDVPIGGYRGLIDAMARGLPIRLGVVVTEVEVSASRVRVHTADGAVEEGSHAVVTLPLGVLKRRAVRFTPGLPREREMAIDRLGFGTLEKIALSFAEPFWRAADIPHLFVLPEDEHEPGVVVIGQDAFGAGPALVFLVYHGASHHVLGRSSRLAADWALSMLRDATGHPCPEPTGIAVSSWLRDPYAFGAYTHNAPSGSPTDVDLLGQPLFDRLLFAGEATTVPRMGFADGAMQSGIREAKRLLHQPSVTLGPLVPVLDQQ